MEYTELRKAVEAIMKKAKPYNIENLDAISDELDELLKPLEEELTILSNDEKVKNYIELSKKVNCIKNNRLNLCSYYPK